MILPGETEAGSAGTQPPNKCLKLTAPGLEKNCVCAPAPLVLVSSVSTPGAGRRCSLSASR